MPQSLDEGKTNILLEFWNKGMTSTKASCEEQIENAAKAAGITELQVKNWIGNQRKKLGLSRKRRPRPQKEGNKVPCKIRKTSAYQLFKSDFLKSDLAKNLRRQGFLDAEVQRRANAVWSNVALGEKQAYEERAKEANANPPKKEETKVARARKLASHIRTCIDQLDELGYPSMWVALIDSKPERHLSKKIQELSQDEAFADYAFSAMVKITAKDKMKESHHECAEKKTKKKKKTKTATKTKPRPMYLLLDKRGKEGVAEVEKTDGTTVHGRVLTPGWGTFLVKRLLKPSVKPWKDFPTHSGEVEEGSFIAWPLTHIKAKEKDKMPRRNEVSSLVDALHPGVQSSRSRTTRSVVRM